MAELIKLINGVPVRARERDKFVNATALCKAGGRLWTEYERLPSTQVFLDKVASNMGLSRVSLIQKRRGNGGGTWVHPRVAIDLCQWISPEFRAMVSEWIEALLTDGHVELPHVAPQSPPPSGFVSLEPDPDDPLAGQIIALQQNLALMLETRRRQVAIERQQQELVRQHQHTQALVAEARADVADTRALAVCAHQTARAALDQSQNNHGKMQVLGYARTIGLELSESEASAHGKNLSRHCRENGIEVVRHKHERYGFVNLYPESVLQAYFESLEQD